MTLQEHTPSAKRRQKKEAVFELLNSHAKREFRMVGKHELIVPINDYQRDESEGRIATEIAMHFDVVAFCVLLVIERANGELIVADGGTRLAGAKRRSDVPTVPCLVFSGLTDKQEADVFLRVNNNRRKLQTEQLHHAELFSEHELAMRSQDLLDRLQARRIGFDSLRTMRSCVKTNNTAIGTLIEILISIANDKYVTARVMKGLFRLEVVLNKRHMTLNRRNIIARMQREFGSFDAVVNAVVKPQSLGSTMDMARALARTLRIKFPVKE
jgi:hypothetical protein